MTVALERLLKSEFPVLLVLVVGDVVAEAGEGEAVGDVAIHDGADDVGHEVGQLQAVVEEDVFHPLPARKVGYARWA